MRNCNISAGKSSSLFTKELLKKKQEIRQVGSSDSPKNSFAEVKETKVRLKDILVNYDKMSVTH